MTRPASTRDLFAAKPRNQTRDQFARGCRNVCGKPPTPTGPGTLPSRTPGTRLHVVKIMVDGKRRTRAEAEATFAGKEWARGAVYVRMSGGYYVFEVPE
jgi:hypothetical protein